MNGRQVWVLASGNRGKLEEFRALLEHDLVDLKLQSEFGIASAEETASTFVENALLKARHACRLSGLPALADDSGLVVDALGGAPGIRSARYAGEHSTDEANVAKLLDALQGVAPERRTARFQCVIVALRGEHDPTPVVAHGCWDGYIAAAPRGHAGFGYDPVFVDGTSGATAAELGQAAKNRISHRARALTVLREALGLRAG